MMLCNMLESDICTVTQSLLVLNQDQREKYVKTRDKKNKIYQVNWRRILDINCASIEEMKKIIQSGIQ